MNTNYQIQIKTQNWDGGSPVITKSISLEDLTKFANLASIINKNFKGDVWNWFGQNKGLPKMWDGSKYVLDTWGVANWMKQEFDYDVEDFNLIKEFYLRFTPNGCDGIKWIKFFKVEELTAW